MASIKLNSLTFTPPPFRKLGDMKIEFAERITLIAGHNGIGKSTILGLTASGSGLRDKAHSNYFNRVFDANLNEIIHLDYVREFEDYKSQNSELPSPTLEYDVDGEIFVKRCALTGRTARREVRVVSRSVPHSEKISADGTIVVGPDAKMPLPTLYLGMTRMLPIGESDPASIMNATDDSIHKDDAKFIQEFIAQIINFGAKKTGPTTITTQSIKGTKKTAKHPGYDYSTKCISLGQDSLGAIATAVASFKKLQREWDQYPGGLLVIDELDAGFHPHAQIRLVKALANAARHLNLQIIATTHSVALIEAIHPDSNPVGKGGKHVDGVVYLVDTQNPRVANDYSLLDIQRDMSLILHPPEAARKAPTLKIYLEDPEAHYFLKKLLTPALKRRVKQKAGVNLKPIPLSVGCGNLMGFHKHDPYFKTVLIALDADATVKGSKAATQNIVKLPGAKGASGKGLSPEATIYKFIQTLVAQNKEFPVTRAALQSMRVTSDYLQEHLLDMPTNITDRVSAKKWMVAKLGFIDQWKLVELWCKEHPTKVEEFEKALVAAAIKVAPLS